MNKLFIINQSGSGRSFDLNEGITFVGRSPNNNIQIKDKSISRRHVKILIKGKAFFIVDMQSTNGTFIDDQKILPGKEYEVRYGVPVSMGNIFFTLGKRYTGSTLPVPDSIDISEDISGSTGARGYVRQVTTLKDLELIHKVSNVLMQSLDINEILEKILNYIFDFLNRIDRGVIILVDNKTGKILDVISRFKESSDDTIMMYSRSIVDRVIKEGKPVIMSDTIGEIEERLSESMELMKIKSLMCVPLISRSQIRGVIYVDSVNKPYGFRKEDLSILTALSSPAAIAIENALIYSELEKKVEEKTVTLSETEEKLRESEVRFKAIFNNMSSGVVVYKAADNGEDFIILDLNKADQTIEEIRKDTVIDKSVFDIFPDIKNNGLLEIIQKVWETGKPENCSVTLSADGKINAWRDYYVYRLDSGEIVTIFDDITAKKKAEEEQVALQQQLVAAQKMETIGAFAGGTAHNFRNILQAVSGNIEYLELLYGKDKEIKELAKSIYSSVERGSELINNLLHFSKRSEKYELVITDLADVIMETHEIIKRVMKKDIEIKLNVGEKLFVKGSRSLLGQVLMNLFTNARDAMPDGGRLSIKAKKIKSTVVATITDTGHGMDKDTIEKIFDPFFTLKEVDKGTGLGLSTSYGIIEQHAGSISASSKPGKGTIFKITLPLAQRSAGDKH